MTRYVLFGDAYRRIVSLAMAVVMTASPFFSGNLLTAQAAATVAFMASAFMGRTAYAQMTPEQAATLGNTDGNAEKAKVRMPSVAPNGDMTLHSTNAAVEGKTFTIDQLFSAGSNSATNTSALNAGAGTYGDMNAMSAQSGTQISGLLATSNSSPRSNAYKTLRDSKLNNPAQSADLRSDSAITSTQAIVHGTDASNFLNGMNGGCKTIVTSSDKTKTLHVAEMHTCDRYVGAPFCMVERAAIGEPTPEKTALTFSGTISELLSIDLQFVTGAGGNFTGFGNTATLTTQLAPVDLQLANSANSSDMNLAVYSLSNAQAALFTKPVEVTYTIVGLPAFGSVNITQPTAANGYRLSVLINGGTDINKYIQLSIKYSTTTVEQVAIQQDPPNCVTNAKCQANPTTWVSSGRGLDLASTNVWECTEGYTDLITGGLVLTPPGAEALPGIFPNEPVGPGIPACFKARARDYQCSVPLGSDVSTCHSLETNSACHFVKTECLPQNKDLSTRQCLLQTETWDCGSDTIIVDIETSRKTVCAGTIRCMGASCIDEPPPEKNGDFNQVAAQLNIAEYANFDKDCDTGSGECAIFKGEGAICSVVFGGVVNCCDAPSGPSLADYIKLGYYAMKFTNRSGAFSYLDGITGNAITGYWKEARDFATSTYETAKDSIVSLFESTLTKSAETAAANSLETAGSWSFSAIEGQMMSVVHDWVVDVFGSTAAGSLFSPSAMGSYQLNAEVSAAMELISNVFMYYTIILLAIQIIYECKPEEIELSVKQAMRQCHYLGRYCGRSFLGICFYRVDSYCCFKSPLARILNEQVRLASDLPWDEPQEHPACPGLTTSQLANADWSKIDLSEWTDLLTLADLRPKDATTADQMYAQDNVTRVKGPTGYLGTSTKDNATTALTINTPSNATQSVRAQLWATLP